MNEQFSNFVVGRAFHRTQNPEAIVKRKDGWVEYIYIFKRMCRKGPWTMWKWSIDKEKYFQVMIKMWYSKHVRNTYQTIRKLWLSQIENRQRTWMHISQKTRCPWANVTHTTVQLHWSQKESGTTLRYDFGYSVYLVLQTRKRSNLLSLRWDVGKWSLSYTIG